MPDSGYFKKRPRKESVDSLLKYLRSNPLVDDMILESKQSLIVKRPEKGDLRVHLTNTYIVGEADVHEILSDDPSINAIVTMSQWNGYTSGAKLICKEQGVGLFKFSEFLGAVYHAGKKFLDYAPPSNQERQERSHRYRR
jgi:hypothetical protein